MLVFRDYDESNHCLKYVVISGSASAVRYLDCRRLEGPRFRRDVKVSEVEP